MTNIYTQLKDLRRQAASSLPKGEARKMFNDIDRITARLHRYERRDVSNSITGSTPEDMSTYEQIRDRYIAKQAIFAAMVAGRHISMLNSHEFKVSEMHTQMHCIKRDIADRNLPYIVHDRWIPCGTAGKRCKEYWLTAKEGEE